MKTIATINFKGGVGKTTLTWALGKVASQKAAILLFDLELFDLDAQMSLTQSIALNEDGQPFKDSTDWYDKSVPAHRTIFDALDLFTQPQPFTFEIDRRFVYRISSNYHFTPSAQELYWTELELFGRGKVKYFNDYTCGVGDVGEVLSPCGGPTQ